MPLCQKKLVKSFHYTQKPRFKKSCSVLWRLDRSLHSGARVCIAEAWSAWWRLGLLSKSGRLVSAQQRLMTSVGSLPRWATGKTYFESILKNQMKGLEGAWSLFLFSYFLRGGDIPPVFQGGGRPPNFPWGAPVPPIMRLWLYP